MRATTRWLCASVFAFAAACGGDVSERGSPGPAPAAALTLSPVSWNQANADLGTVATVLESGKTTAVFGSNGVQFFAGGVLVATDTVVRAWRVAATVPAADGISTWMIGVDAEGKLLRVRPEAPPEDVTARFGLTSRVHALAGAGDRAAFLVEGGFAIADGKNVTRYDASDQRSIATAQGRVAVATERGVRVLEQGRETDIALPGAALVAFDGGGRLFAATPRCVYEISGTTPTLAYDAGSRTVRGLAGAGANVWFAVDGDLGLLVGGKVSVASGGALGPDTRLVGSPSGDVWSTSGGKLSRFSAQVARGEEATWIATVRPVHDAICASCHGARGSGKDASNLDLSTYALWGARKAKIRTRVVDQAGTQTAMPPKGAGYTLTADQKAAIDAWSK